MMSIIFNLVLSPPLNLAVLILSLIKTNVWDAHLYLLFFGIHISILDQITECVKDICLRPSKELWDVSHKHDLLPAQYLFWLVFFIQVNLNVFAKI
jgi:hypothetical protein